MANQVPSEVVETLYQIAGGDYAGVIGRLRTNERIAKFVTMFADDASYATLIDNMAAENWDKAVRGAGTLSWNRRHTDGLRHFHFCERLSSGVSDDKKAYKAQRAETSGALYRHIFGDLSGHFTSNEL